MALRFSFIWFCCFLTPVFDEVKSRLNQIILSLIQLVIMYWSFNFLPPSFIRNQLIRQKSQLQVHGQLLLLQHYGDHHFMCQEILTISVDIALSNTDQCKHIVNVQLGLFYSELLYTELSTSSTASSSSFSSSISTSFLHHHQQPHFVL